MNTEKKGQEEFRQRLEYKEKIALKRNFARKNPVEILDGV